MSAIRCAQRPARAGHEHHQPAAGGVAELVHLAHAPGGRPRGVSVNGGDREPRLGEVAGRLRCVPLSQR